MRRGFDGLASQVRQHLGHDPFDGQSFVFRGKRGDFIKVLCCDCNPAFFSVRGYAIERAG
jgi:transposase